MKTLSIVEFFVNATMGIFGLGIFLGCLWVGGFWILLGLCGLPCVYLSLRYGWME